MVQGVRRGVLVACVACAVSAGAFFAGMAYAADARLDQADQAVQKAIALLQAAENPNVEPPFGGHRKNAIHDLEKARKQIELAKKYADNPDKKKNKGKGKKDDD